MMDTVKIVNFICEEVQRQGFDLKTQDGLDRVEWMLNAWQEAILTSSYKNRQPDYHSIRLIGELVEPTKNARGYRIVPLRYPPDAAPPEQVPVLMQKWVDDLPKMEPDDAYLAFEKIHPFADGNGRVGKILHNWLNGTLGEPVLVKDFFGQGVP